MNNLVTSANNTISPFDAIRHQDGDQEYWLARELMEVMGYTLWQNFESAVNEAIENLKLTGDNVLDHFLLLSIKKDGRETRGRKGKDYRLSRYACYMIALCCDGRKVEVASAKKYFAVKTREAETVIPQQSARIQELELELALAREINASKRLDSDMLTMHGKEIVLALRGMSDQVVKSEVLVTEVVQPETGRTAKILTADQLKSEIKKRTGQKIPSLKWVADKLRAMNRDDLLVPVTRHSTNEYITPDSLDEVIDLVFGTARQTLIGE